MALEKMCFFFFFISQKGSKLQGKNMQNIVWPTQTKLHAKLERFSQSSVLSKNPNALFPPNPSVTVCQDGQGCCGVLCWISFILNSLICWTSKRDNFIFSTPTFVILYFCFPRKVCNVISLFFQKHTKEDMLAFLLLEKNEIMLLTYERKGRTMILFHSRGKFSYHR